MQLLNIQSAESEAKEKHMQVSVIQIKHIYSFAPGRFKLVF